MLPLALTVVTVASAQEKKGLVIEGKQEASAIEEAPLAPFDFESGELSLDIGVLPDPAALLDDPELLLGIGPEGLPIPIDDSTPTPTLSR